MDHISSINEARQCISMLSKPLVLISDMIQRNINSTDAETQRIMCLDANSANFERDLIGKDKTVNEDIKLLLSENGDKREALQMAFERLQAISEEYEAEKEEILNIAAMFGAFLKKNTIMPFNDPVEKYFKLSIQQAEQQAEITQNPTDIESVETLREWLERYKQQKYYIEIGAEYGCTASEVKGYCQQLLNLKHSGPLIKEMYESEKKGIEAVLRTRSSEILNALASSTSVPSDAILIVENQRIPIHKMYLSMYSECFKAMFMDEFQERNQEEIALEDVDFAGMLELLAVIYPTNSPVTEENVEIILKLADRFIIPSVLDLCKKALKCGSKMKASRKLWLAQRYNLSDLQIEYAQEFKSVEDVKNLKGEPEYVLLDDKTRALILESITS